ncbi:MAG: hypothetical protein ACREP9_09180 [Candidatus Dormibacteraceae bacterium]
MSEKHPANSDPLPPELSDDEAYYLAHEELHRMREEREAPPPTPSEEGHQ